MRNDPIAASGPLFQHVTAAKSDLYRRVLDVFARAKRQYRLQLRPDEVLAEAAWSMELPTPEEVNAALQQLAEWGNLEAHPDTARVSSLADFYRARYVYRLSQRGEAVEAGLALFAQMLERRAELQTVALEDIANRLQALRLLADSPEQDAAKIHQTLRDLVGVFEGLAENAQAFMAGVARGIGLQQAEAAVIGAYKRRLIDYLNNFVSDLVRRSDMIAGLIRSLDPDFDRIILLVAEREARDAAPGSEREQEEALARYHATWRERWQGLRGWFIATHHEPSQADLLRARVRAAIPQLMRAITALNERRSGRSDRSADFRVLAGWFAGCRTEGEAHRLARAAFALNSARHFTCDPDFDEQVSATTRWAEAPPQRINPRLRERAGSVRGAPPRFRDRTEERRLLAIGLADEARQVEAARRRLATGLPTRLSDLGDLDVNAFGLFLNILGRSSPITNDDLSGASIG